MSPYILAIIILGFWVGSLYILHKKKILERVGLSPWGPFLMWRTEKGRELIDTLARPRKFWRIYAAISLVICMAVMIFIMALLLWEATLVTSIPEESAPSPEMILGIPGINPLIPLWYGILGLVVAILVHEFAHGILTRVGGLKLKSLGLIFLIFPMGAFVEPDEEELKRAEKRKRMSVFAVGPSTNIIVAVVFALLFSSVFLGAVTPVREGPIVVNTAKNSPAYYAGLEFGVQILRINNISVSGPADLIDLSTPPPGHPVTVEYFYQGEEREQSVISGVAITGVTSGLPAYDAGIREGMIIASINDTEIRNPQDLSDALNRTRPYQTVNITVLAYSVETGSFQVVPEIKWITLASRNEYLNSIGREPGERDIGFMGINSAYMGIVLRSVESIKELLAHPFSGADTPGDILSSALVYLSLPFWGFAPVPDSISELFVVDGALSVLPHDVFWILANSFYWIFWINIMVGMTNVLPAVPLDGGYLFRDFMDSVVSRLKKDAPKEERERYVSGITLTLALIVLMLILWQLIGPRIT